MGEADPRIGGMPDAVAIGASVTHGVGHGSKARIHLIRPGRQNGCGVEEASYPAHEIRLKARLRESLWSGDNAGPLIERWVGDG